MLAAVTALLLAGAPAQGAYYRAEPVAAPSRSRVVAGDLLWRCGADGCTAGHSDARAVVDCQSLVRAVGRVRNFSVGGAGLAPDQLERCNARAR